MTGIAHLFEHAASGKVPEQHLCFTTPSLMLHGEGFCKGLGQLRDIRFWWKRFRVTFLLFR